MMQSELLQQGFDLMLFGMGTVFVFLTLLIACTLAMSAVTNRFFPEADPEPALPPSAANVQVGQKTVAIIQAAIDAHKNR